MNNTNKNIFDYSNEIEKFYFSPLVTLANGIHSDDYLNLYTFISKAPNTINEVELPEKQSNAAYTKKVFKNIIFMRKNNLSDINAVIERIDWNANTYYEAYSDTTYLSERDSNGNLLRKFYVRNKYDQVFKCLWNNINSANTISISNVVNNNTYYTIQHSGGTFGVDTYVTIQKTVPEDFNGTYRVIQSDVGVANVAFGEAGSYIFTTANTYISNGTIKIAELSTQEPFFNVGTFDQNSIVRTSDGYKWKYLYTLNKQSKLKCFDTKWIPVPISANTPNPYLSSSGWGSIDVINVINGGTGYENGTNTVNIIISGDGTGASAEAFVSNNSIREITIVDSGKNYTYANVSIFPSYGFGGSGAEVSFSISPIGGHGFNLIRELFCKDVIVSTQFQYGENNILPTDITFNQIGLLYNPYVYSDNTNHANTDTINCTTELLVFSGDYSYYQGETVFQGIDFPTASFSATVLSFDSSNNSIKVINTSGTPKENYELKGTISGTSRVLSSINTPLYVPNSGNIFYLENRPSIERNPLGTEQIRILINYN